MAGPWERYANADSTPTSGPWEKFGGQDAPKQMKLGMDSFKDILREELKGKDWLTRNLIGAGTALSDVYEGVKQFAGAGDRSQIEANQVIADEAPVGAIAGNIALTAVPFAGVTKAATAAKVGAGLGALQPVAGEQTAENITRGKILNTVIGGAAGAGGQAASNKVADVISQKVAGKQLLSKINAPRDELVERAQDLGLVIPPSSVKPSALNNVLESIGGKELTAQQFSNANAKIFDDVARRATGLADDAPLTSEAMQEVRRQAYQRGYEPIKQLGIIPTTKGFDDELTKIAGERIGKGTISATERPDITNLVNAHRNASFDAGDAVNAIRILREDAQTAYRAGDTAMGSAQRAIAKAYEDQIEAALQGSGKNGAQILNDFREARKLMAKSHTIEDAIVEGGGTVDTRKLASRIQSGKPMEGDLKTIAQFANNFKNASKPAKQVAGPGVSALNFLSSAGFGGAGAAIGGGEGATAGALLPFLARPAARRALASRASQNALLDLYGLSLADRGLGALGRYAPVGSTVFSLDALGQ